MSNLYHNLSYTVKATKSLTGSRIIITTLKIKSWFNVSVKYYSVNTRCINIKYVNTEYIY